MLAEDYKWFLMVDPGRFPEEIKTALMVLLAKYGACSRLDNLFKNYAGREMNPEYWNYMGVVSCNENNYAESEKFFKKAFALEEGGVGKRVVHVEHTARLNRYRNNLIIVFAMLNRKKSLRELLDYLNRLNENDPQFRSNRAGAIAIVGNISALREIDVAIKKAEYVGRIQGQTLRAASYAVTAAVRKNMQIMMVKLLLNKALVLEQLKRPATAILTLENALEIAERIKNEELAKKIESVKKRVEGSPETRWA